MSETQHRVEYANVMTEQQAARLSELIDRMLICNGVAPVDAEHGEGYQQLQDYISTLCSTQHTHSPVQVVYTLRETNRVYVWRPGANDQDMCMVYDLDDWREQRLHRGQLSGMSMSDLESHHSHTRKVIAPHLRYYRKAQSWREPKLLYYEWTGTILQKVFTDGRKVVVNAKAMISAEHYVLVGEWKREIVAPASTQEPLARRIRRRS